MRNKWLWVGVAVAAACPNAYAQEEVPRGETVTSRPRPDYDPIGQRIGGFILYPDLSVQEGYDSNIFATQNNAKGDMISSIEPTLDLKSNWNNHALNLHADSRSLIYAEHDSENITDYTFGADGRLDIRHDSRAFGGIGYKVRHEPRSSPNDLGGKEPTEYQDVAGNIAGEKEFNRLSFRLDGNYDRYSYSNVQNGLGAVINESRRNYDDKRLMLHTGYELAPLRQIYLLTGYDWRSYDSTSDIFGFDRNSTGYTLALGAKYDLTGIIFADVFVGYRRQDYRDSRLAPVEGPTGGVKLTWNVTRLTTVTGTIERDVQETVLVNSSGYFATQSNLRVDHELLRNLLLDASVGYERDSFQGISRSDDYYLAGFGAKYLINRNFALSGGYDYRVRSSNTTGVGFDEHTVFVRLSSHL